ncbi:hypothetical protein AnaeK_0546 [Anaeromyxobacter sp. K]|uniref:hypothetical protein n=1 Tax=Anaeromyxobacter sp. (strain K) TaxID=447217 RepID=UPI00015F9E85|nr:hypothetical protein [Anaeromyxobacter sp. K]ACG71785.1 hypothetical protein AnaeK_0546 [Anaeromyxobacter sp. K]
MTRTPWIAAAALALALSGCASVAAQRARTRYLEAELDRLRFPQPAEEIWGDVRRLLMKNEFPLADEEDPREGIQGLVVNLFTPARPTEIDRAGRRTLDTGWRKDQTRVHAEAAPGEGGVQVRLTRLVEDQTEHGRGKPYRDVDLELELARLLAPQEAARIEAGIPKPR